MGKLFPSVSITRGDEGDCCDDECIVMTSRDEVDARFDLKNRDIVRNEKLIVCSSIRRKIMSNLKNIDKEN